MPQKPKQRKTSPSVDVGDSDFSETTLDNSADVGIDKDDIDYQENFDEFFGDGTKRVTLHLFRLEPRYWASKAINGFITELNRGDGWQTIVDNFGGGRYLLRKYIDGKYGRQRQIRIAGDPKVVCPPPSDASADNSGGETRVGSSMPTLDVGGVQVPAGDIELIKRVALFARAMDTIFPKAPDINDTLLQLALNRPNQSNILDQADQFATLADKLKQLTGGGGGATGTTWLDIGSQALNSLEKFVGAAAAKQSGIQAIPQPVDQMRKLPDRVRRDRPAISGSTVDLTLGLSEPKPTEATVSNGIARESNEVGYQDIAEKAASYIAQGYVVEPQQTPGETVQVLGAVLPPMSLEIRRGMESYRKILNMVARNVLSSQMETDAAFLSQFDLYFNQVFDIFVSARNADKNQQPSNGKADDGQSEQSEGSAGGATGPS